MDPETLKTLIELAQQAASVRTIGTDADGRTVILQEQGKLRERATPAPLRSASFHDLESLQAYAAQQVEQGNQPEIWHCEEVVSLVLNNQDRREVLHFPLNGSVELECLSQFAQQITLLPQSDFIRTLRMTLSAPPELIAPFRRLDWSSRSTGGAKVEHGRQSLGKELEAQISGIGELPEEIRLAVPLYRDQGERQQYTIRCLIEIDPIGQRFLLRPASGELEQALQAHQGDIRDRLLAEVDKIPVYYGRYSAEKC